MPAATGSAGGLRFEILGSLRVLSGAQQVEVGPRKQQIVLAALLCHANAPVSVDALTEALWGKTPPRTARKNIQVYVSALRDLVDSGQATRISYGCGGYVLRAGPAELDALSFRQHARCRHDLRYRGQSADTARTLSQALGMWRGPALEGLRDVPLIEAAARRLERQFLDVFEDWAEAEIATGGAAAVIDQIMDVAEQHPLRERLRTLQMTALRDAGRTSEALAVYDELRQSLAHELGLSPSPAVVSFYQSLLREHETSRQPAPLVLLPWDPPGFTGRAGHIRRLTDALTGPHRVVVLTGAAGSGKTALAAHAARQLGDCFPDGRLFIRLRRDDGSARPAGEILSWLTQAIAPVPRPVSPAEAARAWQLWLANNRALVIFDDARAEREVRPFLPEAGDSAVLITARPRLAGLGSAHRLRVPPFDADEALEFLGLAIGHDRVAADEGAARQIVLAAGLLPLSVRLIAERLVLLHHVPLREYARRVAGPQGLLDELAAGDAAIRELIAGVAAALPGPASRALERLGLLTGPVFTLEEAAAVLAESEDATIRLLETMLETSVIAVPDAETVARTVLYEIPRLVYAYLRELAAAQPAMAGPGCRS